MTNALSNNGGEVLNRSHGLAAVPRTDGAGVPSGRVREETDYRALVGRRVRLQRQALGLNQQEIADVARISRNFVSAIERGRQGLDAWRLGLLADALGISTDWLLDRIPGPITVPGPRPRPRV